MAMSRKPPIQQVSLPTQNLHVQKRFPAFRYRWKHGKARWIGYLQPQDASPMYTVEITYSLTRYPKVRVLNPVLSPKAQHLYRDGSLCLYWPKEWVWHTDNLIAETIIPWTCLWLLHYELLMDTGEWLGPSSHAQPSEK